MSTRKRDAEPSVDLFFGSAMYAYLAAAGTFGLIPLTAWLASILVPLTANDHSGMSTFGSVVVGAGTIVFLFAPAVVPCLVLRARQPRGARIAWDDYGIVEWDGPWKKTIIAWEHVVATHAVWEIATKSGKKTLEALALADRATGAVIHAWESPPAGAPVVRRRLCVDSLQKIHAALTEHRIAMAADAPDWSRAAAPARSRPRAIVWIGRLGYFTTLFATLAPPPSASAVGALTAVLLTVRALPVLGELRGLVGRRSSPPSRESDSSQPEGYREAARAAPVETDEAGRAVADRLRRRAVSVEAAVRMAFVALAVASTWVGATSR